MSGQLACLWCGNPSWNTDLCVRCATAKAQDDIEAEARSDYERAVCECDWLDGPDESDSGY